MGEPTTTDAATGSAARAATKPERTRTSDSRVEGSRAHGEANRSAMPAAGAHAAVHLLNEDATPGAGALPGRAHGREVDGAAG